MRISTKPSSVAPTQNQRPRHVARTQRLGGEQDGDDAGADEQQPRHDAGEQVVEGVARLLGDDDHVVDRSPPTRTTGTSPKIEDEALRRRPPASR